MSSQIKVNTINDASGGNNAVLYGPACPDNSMGFRNRIINGAMMIDQRNAGASVTPTVNLTYTVDRWVAYLNQASKFSVQQSTTAPAGFINSVKITSTSAYTVGSTEFFGISQNIEGLNVADLGWGTENAQAVTLSFWVRSSLTGAFGGSFVNSAGSRAYPFSYTIGSANTWEQKTITVAGDTSGTWLTNNGIGIGVIFGLGVGSSWSGTSGSWSSSYYLSATGATSVVGTNGATFYITGVQLEAGSVATPFERRPYGTELALCQRYYARVTTDSQFQGIASGVMYGASGAEIVFRYPVVMRASPSINGATLRLTNGSLGSDVTAIGSGYIGASSALQHFNCGAVFAAGQPANLIGRSATGGYVDFSAEL